MINLVWGKDPYHSLTLPAAAGLADTLSSRLQALGYTRSDGPRASTSLHLAIDEGASPPAAERAQKVLSAWIDGADRGESSLPIPLILSCEPHLYQQEGFDFPDEFLLGTTPLELPVLLARAQSLARIWGECFRADLLRDFVVGRLRELLQIEHHQDYTLLRTLYELEDWKGDPTSLQHLGWASSPDSPSRWLDRVDKARQPRIFADLFRETLSGLRSQVEQVQEMAKGRPPLNRLRELSDEVRKFLPKRSGAYVMDLPCLKPKVLIIDDEAKSVRDALSGFSLTREPLSSKVGDLVDLCPAVGIDITVSENIRFTEIRERLVQFLQCHGKGGLFADSRKMPRIEAADFILLDLSLRQGPREELGGIDILRLIRDRLPDLPVLIFSSFSDQRHVIHAIQTGASWFCAKSDADSVLSSLFELTQTVSWEKELKRRNPALTPEGIFARLSPLDSKRGEAPYRYICWKLVSDFPEGVIKVEPLGGGIGGALTLRVQVVQPTGQPEHGSPIVPLVVKIDRPYRMLGEQERYVRFISPYLENRVGRVGAKFVKAGRELAGISYTFSGSHQGSGGRLRRVTTRRLDEVLRENLRAAAPLPFTAYEPLFDELLGEVLGTIHSIAQSADRGWARDEFEEATTLRESFDLRLPVNLELRLQSISEPKFGREPEFTPDSEVRIFDSFIRDVTTHHVTIVAASGADRPDFAGPWSNVMRIKLRGPLVSFLAHHRSLRPTRRLAVTGRKIRSRREILGGLLGETVKAELEALGCADPILCLSEVLDILDKVERSGLSRVAIVHGDLNLGNVLVECSEGNRLPFPPHPWLIDFARTRRDSIVHDFAELEVDLLVTLLPGLGPFSALDLRDFFVALDYSPLDQPEAVRSSLGLRFLFEAASFVRSRAAHAGVSKREYLAALYLYYLVVLKIHANAIAGAEVKRTLCAFGASAAAIQLVRGGPA